MLIYYSHKHLMYQFYYINNIESIYKYCMLICISLELMLFEYLSNSKFKPRFFLEPRKILERFKSLNYFDLFICVLNRLSYLLC